ncbi:DUF397 domain-containing protein [Streptomyces sp. bgisy060]|uniref:DUF397 domain-containing protein n=1 Tax=Streptomyces sp. bgisy060 TaxID=3413775 RepID=UPI003EB8B065
MTTEQPQWFTSSYSNNGGNCVKVATNLAATHGIIPMGDTKRPSGPTVPVPLNAFAAFIAGIKSGQLGS